STRAGTRSDPGRRRGDTPPGPTASTGSRSPRPPLLHPPGPGLLLHLHHEGEDHRAAVQALEVTAKGPVDLLLHLDRIGAGLGVDPGEGLEDGPAGCLQDLRARPLAHDATRHEVGAGDDLARLLVDRQDGEDEAVLREVAAVAEDDVPDLADPLPVDE